jgi:hypothetical protein
MDLSTRLFQHAEDDEEDGGPGALGQPSLPMHVGAVSSMSMMEGQEEHTNQDTRPSTEWTCLPSMTHQGANHLYEIIAEI